MRKTPHVGSALVVLVLSGCATYQSTDSDPSIACMARVQSMPELAPLKAKIGSLAGASQDLDVLADTSVPSPAEKLLIKQWHTSRLACMNEGEGFRAAKTIPGYAGLVSVHTSSMNRIVAKLYQGEMTYGEFAAQRTQIYETLQSSESQIHQDFEVREQQAKRQAAMNYLMLQSAMPRPAAPVAPVAPAANYRIVVQPQPVYQQPVYVPPRTINCNSYTHGTNTQTTCQ